jgi:hypothetical protein
MAFEKGYMGYFEEERNEGGKHVNDQVTAVFTRLYC